MQRKHQKLLEEAPSSGLDAALRNKMARVAVKLAKGAGYESLGTVEFLLDKMRGTKSNEEFINAMSK